MNETITDILNILLRSFLSIGILFLLSRMLGPRQISQMSFYDYILGITIGSIAATMAIDNSIPMYYSIIAMSSYAMFTFIISILTNKSIKIRKFFTGTPKVLIDNGVIIEQNLKKTHIDTSDLTSAARAQGLFNLNDIFFAIMEPTGNISFLQRAETLPVTLKDMNINADQNALFANIIIDGNIIPEALSSIGRDENWLKQQLISQNISSLSEVLLAISDCNGQINIYRNNQSLSKKNYFM